MSEEPRRLFGGDEVVVVNPNDRVYSSTYGGQRADFHPFERVALPSDKVEWYMSKAERNFSQAKIDAVDTEREALACLSSKDFKKRARAARYINDDGSLRNPAWDFPCLVIADSETGKKTIAEAKAFYEKKASQPSGSGDLPAIADQRTRLVRPQAGWGREGLRDYISDNFGVWKGPEKVTTLLSRAEKIYKMKSATLEEAGNQVVEMLVDKYVSTSD